MTTQRQLCAYPDLGKPTIRDRVVNVLGKRYFAGSDMRSMVAHVRGLDNRRTVLNAIG